MKSEDVPDEVGKFIGQKLDSFMWDIDKSGNINAILFKFDKGTVILQTGDTFIIRIQED